MGNLDNPNFNFKHISFVQKLSEIQKVNPKKAAPVKNIQKNNDLLTFYIHHNFNNCVWNYSLKTTLKYADIRPALKKNGKTDKEN